MADPRTNVRPNLDIIFTDKFFQVQSTAADWPSLLFAVPLTAEELQDYFNQAKDDPNNKRNLFTQGAYKISDDIKDWATDPEHEKKVKQIFYSDELQNTADESTIDKYMLENLKQYKTRSAYSDVADSTQMITVYRRGDVEKR